MSLALSTQVFLCLQQPRCPTQTTIPPDTAFCPESSFLLMPSWLRVDQIIQVLLCTVRHRSHMDCLLDHHTLHCFVTYLPHTTVSICALAFGLALTLFPGSSILHMLLLLDLPLDSRFLLLQQLKPGLIPWSDYTAVWLPGFGLVNHNSNPNADKQQHEKMTWLKQILLF